jgi:hypothetical protein
MFLRSALYKRTALADLRKIQRLTPALQNEIAAKALPPERAARANRAEAEIVAIWNSRQAGGRALWFYPTIGAAIAAKLPWLSFSCPACGAVRLPRSAHVRSAFWRFDFEPRPISVVSPV